MSNWKIAVGGVAIVGFGYLSYNCFSRKALNDAGAEKGGQKSSALEHISAMLNERIKQISQKVADCSDEEAYSRTVYNFHASHGLTTPEAKELLKIRGRNELLEYVTPTGRIIFRQLTGPMPIMLWSAAILEFKLGNYAGVGILLGFQFINAGLSYYETSKAGNVVAAWKASLKPLAFVKRDGRWQNMDATLLVPGDLVKLAAGSAVPADCYVNEGELELDQSILTGQYQEVKFRPGDICKMGTLVVRGEVDGTVHTTGVNTSFGQPAAILRSIENVEGSLPTSLLGMMKVLIYLPVSLCVISFTSLVINDKRNDYLPHMLKKDSAEIFKDALSFAGVVLISSIPFAIELVTTATLAVGSRSLLRHGAIVTRLAALEEIAGLDMLCMDKTGTLTLNRMIVQDDCPTFAPGESRETILFQAALASKWDEPPRDGIDTMILIRGLNLPQRWEGDRDVEPEGQRNLDALNRYTQLDFEAFDPRKKRTEGKLQAPDGSIFRISKGAPHVILNMCYNKDVIEAQVVSKVHELGTRGICSLAVARQDNEDGRWKFLGILTFLDPPCADTKETIEFASILGVEVKMITGDDKTIATETARVLGMSKNIQGPDGLPVLHDSSSNFLSPTRAVSMQLREVLGAGGETPMNLAENYGGLIVPAPGFAQVLPEQKYLIVETLRQVGYRCGMVGDSVADAPALKRADVSIAVQGSMDAARAAADIVLTEGRGLGAIINALKVARETFARLKSFVTYSISASLQLPMFFSIALFALPPRAYFDRVSALGSATASVPAPKIDCWPSFFQLPVPMLILSKLLNDGALWLSNCYDRVIPSPIPERWNIGYIFTISSVLGAVSCSSSLLLLWAALDSNNPHGVFASMGIPPMEYGKIITMMFLKVSISDLLTFFSARTQARFFWETAPSGYLLGAAMASLSISTYLASFWPTGQLGGIPVMGLARGDYKLMPQWIWIYCLVWWFIQDAAKVATSCILMSMPRFRPFKVDRRKYEEAKKPLPKH